MLKCLLYAVPVFKNCWVIKKFTQTHFQGAMELTEALPHGGFVIIEIHSFTVILLWTSYIFTTNNWTGFLEDVAGKLIMWADIWSSNMTKVLVLIWNRKQKLNRGATWKLWIPHTIYGEVGHSDIFVNDTCGFTKCGASREQLIYEGQSSGEGSSGLGSWEKIESAMLWGRREATKDHEC